jgi:imidazolonepropionase-like amidohydrolase
VALAVLAALLTSCAMRDTSVRAAGAAPTLALVGGRVQTSPEGPVIADGVVLVTGDTITAVGSRTEVLVPPGTFRLSCVGATVTAGFWNSHVHFTQPIWSDAASAPPERLAAGLRDMLTSRGFVRVVDTGSDPRNTQALRRRIDSGEIPGPAVLMAGGSLAPAGGSPFYILPSRLPEVATPAEAERLVDAVLTAGADAIKLFTGSFAERGTIVVMPVEIVRAAADAAHRRGVQVFAHPSNSAGARAAIEGGVDILAHTFPSEIGGPWDRSLPGRMRERGMALVPTLKLWPYEGAKFKMPTALTERLLGNGEAQLREFTALGGQVLFGTDVGYMLDYDPTDEFVYMQRAGLSAAQILTALTTAPAARFGLAARTGRIAVGYAADFTVVIGNPDTDIRALGQVRYTLRGGRVLFDERDPVILRIDLLARGETERLTPPPGGGHP